MPQLRLPAQSFRWLLAEVVVIVAGILLAISIDAWWKEREDREDEQELLQALVGEFKVNRALLERQIEVSERRTVAASALLGLRVDPSSLRPEEVDWHWRWVIRGAIYSPLSGVLESAVSTGKISLLRDAELRILLANWPGEVFVLSDVNGRITNLIFDQMVPWIRTRSALPDYSFGETGIPIASSEIDYELLNSSTVVENFLREEVGWGRVIARQEKKLNGTIEQIRERIELALIER